MPINLPPEAMANPDIAGLWGDYIQLMKGFKETHRTHSEAKRDSEKFRELRQDIGIIESEKENGAEKNYLIRNTQVLISCICGCLQSRNDWNVLRLDWIRFYSMKSCWKQLNLCVSNAIAKRNYSHSMKINSKAPKWRST